MTQWTFFLAAMAAGSSSSSTVPDGGFDSFYADLKETEKKDSTLTPSQQIDRLLRPGATSRNLNPFEVLMIEPSAPMEEVRKKYRRLSILVHPDKNQQDKVRKRY